MYYKHAHATIIVATVPSAVFTMILSVHDLPAAAIIKRQLSGFG